MSVAVVNSGGANIASVLHALGRLGAEPRFTDDPDVIRKADRVILPGVGAAGHAMDVLGKRNLIGVIKQLEQPVIGICLGMQLLFESSEEDDAQLLGLIPARLKKIPQQIGLRVPHMGWNAIENTGEDHLNATLGGKWFYFVHSYAAPIGPWTLSTSQHGVTFSAIVRKNNFYGAQFHPERSASAGASLLRRFLETPLP
jgi:glutamine amidotransferase